MALEEKCAATVIRCFAKFVYDNEIVKKDEFSVETDAGIKYIKLDIGH